MFYRLGQCITQVLTQNISKVLKKNGMGFSEILHYLQTVDLNEKDKSKIIIPWPRRREFSQYGSQGHKVYFPFLYKNLRLCFLLLLAN